DAYQPGEALARTALDQRTVEAGEERRSEAATCAAGTPVARMQVLEIPEPGQRGIRVGRGFDANRAQRLVGAQGLAHRTPRTPAEDLGIATCLAHGCEVDLVAGTGAHARAMHSGRKRRHDRSPLGRRADAQAPPGTGTRLEHLEQ